MRMSCNGCRVLRKGCSEDCTIRPCLQWIKNPEAQGNATVFLAKFYGRAGLLNLINAGPDKHRPAIFRSLLYEACGRIVNPIYGSVGLLWSGNRQLCQAAVEAVLKGEPIVQISSEKAADISIPPLKTFDIRHVTKNAAKLNVSKASQTPFKLSSIGTGAKHVNRLRLPRRERSHHESGGGTTTTTTSSASGSMISAETVEPSTPDPERRTTSVDPEDELDLTLGLGFSSSAKANKHSSLSSCSPNQAKIPSERCRVDNLALFLTA